MDKAAWVILVLSELGEWLLPIYYTQTKWGNYSDGIYTYVCYASVAFYLLLCSGMLFGNLFFYQMNQIRESFGKQDIEEIGNEK